MTISQNLLFGLPWLSEDGEVGVGTDSGVSLSEQQNINKQVNCSKPLQELTKGELSSLLIPILSGGGGCSAPPLRFFAHNSGREKDNSTKFGDFPENI